MFFFSFANQPKSSPNLEQIQPKSLFLFHKNCSPRNLCIMTLQRIGNVWSNQFYLEGEPSLKISISYDVSAFKWIQILMSTNTHCSYLDIYISQNIRLWKGDFEGKFQPNLQAKAINFFIWKFRFILLIFLLFFAEFVKSTAFYTLLLLF